MKGTAMIECTSCLKLFHVVCVKAPTKDEWFCQCLCQQFLFLVMVIIITSYSEHMFCFELELKSVCYKSEF